MRFRTPLAAAAVALGLVAFGGRPLQAQDSIPAASKDTSRAAKVRTDTVTQAYKPMGTPADCPAPGAAVAARLPGDTTAAARVPADTTARDTVTVAQVDSAQRRAAEAVGVYYPPPKTPSVTATPCPPAAGKPDSVTVRPVKPDSVQATPQPADTAKPR